MLKEILNYFEKLTDKREKVQYEQDIFQYT